MPRCSPASRSRRLGWVLPGLLAVALFLDAQTSTSQNLELLSQYGGFMWDAVASEDYVYLSRGGLLITVDRATGEDAVGSATSEVGELQELQILDGLLYGCNADGTLVFSLDNPASPVLLDILYPGICAVDTVVGYFAITREIGEIRSYDVSNPGEPVLVDSYRMPEGAASLHVVGDHVVAMDRFTGLLTFVVEASGELDLRTETPLGEGENWDAEIKDGNQLILSHGLGLQAFDLVDPENPAPLWSLPMDETSFEIALHKDYLVTLSGNHFSRFFTVVGPLSATQPEILSRPAGGLLQLFDGGDAVLFPDCGLNIASVSQTGSLDIQHQYGDLNLIEQVEYIDGKFYLLDSCGAFYTGVVSSSGEFDIEQKIAVSGRPSLFDVQPPYACLVTEISGSILFNLSQGNDGSPISVIPEGDDWPRLCRFEGNRLYISEGGEGIRIFDISLPSQPRFIGSITRQTLGVDDLYVEGFDVQDSVLCIPNYSFEGEVLFVDAVRARNPRVMETYSNPNFYYPYYSEFRRNRWHMSDLRATFILSFDEATSIVSGIGFIPDIYWKSFDVTDSYLCGSGLSVFDITSLPDIDRIASGTSYSQRIAMREDDGIILATQGSSVRVYRLNPPDCGDRPPDATYTSEALFNALASWQVEPPTPELDIYCDQRLDGLDLFEFARRWDGSW